MSGLNLQDDSQSADGQLQLGLQLIQQSYNRRVEELTREVEHWKRVAQHHKQQEAQTREELGKSNQRGSELQRQLAEKNQEVAQLTEARNVALNQIATLKKHASQLQSFKKNISNMLQVLVYECESCDYGGEGGRILPSNPCQILLPAFPLPISHSLPRSRFAGGMAAAFGHASRPFLALIEQHSDPHDCCLGPTSLKRFLPALTIVFFLCRAIRAWTR